MEYLFFFFKSAVFDIFFKKECLNILIFENFIFVKIFKSKHKILASNQPLKVSR